MTPEELRDLDAEVHVRVMRKPVFTDRYGCHWTDEHGPLGPTAVPRYSTDLGAAWKVLEKMGDRAGGIRSVLKAYGKWGCRIGGTATVEHETAPIAICRAALKWLAENPRSLT